MAIHSVKNIQKIPAALEEVWDFYSSHANLQTITPPSMKFKVISQNNDEKLYPGQIIEYKVSPVLAIPLYWKTEIREVVAPGYFMDEQRKGPYSAWQHQHYFKAIEGGTEMTDIVLYKTPLGPLGELANILFIKGKLRNIFRFRFNKMEEIFGKWPGGQEMEIEIR
jgi:ligand-binding SRPBCC domain-containing protein